MDNHPIPQDVTNFQFRLIGEMTLKQFGYVAGGVIFAWVVLASPLPFFIKFLLAGGCVMAGVILAFVPIEGRPSDVMVMRFLKALFSPTQFTYQKTPQQPFEPPMRQITSTPAPIKQEVKKEEKPQTVMLESTPVISTVAAQAHTQKQTEPIAPVTPEEKKQETAPSVQKENVLEEQVAELTKELVEAKTEEQHTKGTAESTAAHEKVTDLQGQLQEIMQQKQLLEKQLVELQKTLNQKKQQVYSPSTVQEPTQTTQHVKRIPKQMSTSIGAPLVPDVPNLITGVIKDSRGNVLPNILIEVKDKDNNPVRAFKTNPLGQFASATPLLNGTYTVSFEDPSAKHSFDVIEVSANGEILLPFEIISIDARERLRQELFGAGNTLPAQ